MKTCDWMDIPNKAWVIGCLFYFYCGERETDQGAFIVTELPGLLVWICSDDKVDKAFALALVTLLTLGCYVPNSKQETLSN